MGSPSYPSERGIPVHPRELDLPPSTMEPDDPTSYSIHHLLFPASWYLGDSAVFATLRNLESLQIKLPLDQHNTGPHALHTKYGPPRKPSVREALAYIERALLCGDNLRYGSIGRFTLIPLTEAFVELLFQEEYMTPQQFQGLAAELAF